MKTTHISGAVQKTAVFAGAMAFVLGITNCSQGSGLSSITTAQASQAEQGGYMLSLTNGGDMPMSPPTVWVAKNRAGVPEVGSNSTQGQRNVCETGNSAVLKTELTQNTDVSFVHTETALLMPGQTITVVVPQINTAAGEELYVDFMYGKTRNVCGGVFDLDAELVTNKEVKVLRGGDTVFTTGDYDAPTLANINGAACAMTSDPVSCIRSLSAMLSGSDQFQIKTFIGYAPEVLPAIDNIFGAGQSQQLIVPTSGALSYTLEMAP